MLQRLFIPILHGTVRPQSQSGHVAQLIFNKVSANPEIETFLFQPEKMNLDFTDEGEDLKTRYPAYRDAIIRADGLIIVSPEYNHGYPATLKHVLDLLYPEYLHKPVGLIGVSDGLLGGARMIENLTPVLKILGLTLINKDMRFAKIDEMFTTEGELKTEFIKDVESQYQKFIKELLWMVKTLRYGRQTFPV